MKSRVTATLALLVLLGACADKAPDATTVAESPAAVDTAALKDAIQTLEKAWSAAYLTGDASAVAALYSEDAASVPASGDWQQGRAAIAKEMQFQLDSITFTSREDITEEVIPLGTDHVFEIGHYKSEGTYKIGGKSRVSSGRYVVLWRKDADGTWRLLRDLGSEAPAKITM